MAQLLVCKSNGSDFGGFPLGQGDFLVFVLFLLIFDLGGHIFAVLLAANVENVFAGPVGLGSRPTALESMVFMNHFAAAFCLARRPLSLVLRTRLSNFISSR